MTEKKSRSIILTKKKAEQYLKDYEKYIVKVPHNLKACLRLTPRTPFAYFYNKEEWGRASLQCLGYTEEDEPYTLEWQYINDQLWCRCFKDQDKELESWWESGAIRVRIQTPIDDGESYKHGDTTGFEKDKYVSVIFTVEARGAVGTAIAELQPIQVFFGSELEIEKDIVGTNTIHYRYNISNITPDLYEAKLTIRPKKQQYSLGIRSVDIYVLDRIPSRVIQ